MKKYYAVLLIALVILFGSSFQSIAATLDDIAGTYDVRLLVKVKVKGLGKDISDPFGELTLTAGGTFDLDEVGNDNDVSGTVAMDSKGKKAIWELSTAGETALKATLSDWLISAAAQEGITITSPVWSFVKTKMSTVKIDKNTNEPKGSTKISVKGTVSGLVDGEPESSKFAYQAKVIFQ